MRKLFKHYFIDNLKIITNVILKNSPEKCYKSITDNV